MADIPWTADQGGESGPGHRVMDLDWLWDIAVACHEAEVPLFVKQASGPRAGMQRREEQPMALPDPRTIRVDPCPPGWHYEWVPEPAFGWMAWRVAVAGVRQCRNFTLGARCSNQSVAKVNRGKNAEQWWHYCPEHMYGRRVDGQRVWVIHTIRAAGGEAETDG